MAPEKTTSASDLYTQYKTVSLFFLFGGILGVLIGLIHLADLAVSGFSAIGLGDFLQNVGIGVANLGCYSLLRKRSARAIWLFGLTILAIQVYSYAVGRGLNLMMLIVGAVFLWMLFNLQRQNEIG